jgi:hypothetical protein
MITIRSFPAAGGGKFPKFAAFHFEHEHSAGRAENQKVPFPIRVVIEAPADHPVVRHKRQTFGDDQFGLVTTFDRSLVNPSGHIYCRILCLQIAQISRRVAGLRRVALVLGVYI